MSLSFPFCNSFSEYSGVIDRDHLTNELIIVHKFRVYDKVLQK
jgi:hypothetical protein